MVESIDFLGWRSFTKEIFEEWQDEQRGYEATHKDPQGKKLRALNEGKHLVESDLHVSGGERGYSNPPATRKEYA